MTLKRNTSPSPLISGFKYRKQCVGGRSDCDQALDVNKSEMITSADLGSSSSYSNELLIQNGLNNYSGRQSFEGRSGEGFFASGAHAKVSRS